MSKVLYKFYDMETMTQEKLNGLALERNTLAKENQELKEQLEKWNKQLKIAEEMITIQRQDGNYNYDEYMLGMYNGMEYIASLFRINEPKFISGKDIKFLHNSHENQQKEFINYLEKEIENSTFLKVSLEMVLQKYKSIIGDIDDEK